MSQLGPFMGSMGGGGAPAAGGAAAAVEEATVEEAAPVEKTHYDVELSAFDAATKIKLIKEIRATLGLGLKEAKETVESAPTWIQKELVKDEADALKVKLEALGATVRLA
jgi:large subunit ribosomal protein L7/L12